MNKILTVLAVSLIAVSSQAVSFTWAGSNQVLINGSAAIASTGAVTAHLLYLGTSTSASITDYTISNGTQVDGVATVSTGFIAANKGKYGDSFSQTLGTDIGGQTYTAGDYFTVILTYTDTESKTWYNLSSTVWQLPVETTDLTQGLASVFTHSYTMNAPGTALTAGGGWVTPVPEPATAALALAGLAMLIRRRK